MRASSTTRQTKPWAPAGIWRRSRLAWGAARRGRWCQLKNWSTPRAPHGRGTRSSDRRALEHLPDEGLELDQHAIAAAIELRARGEQLNERRDLARLGEQ